MNQQTGRETQNYQRILTIDFILEPPKVTGVFATNIDCNSLIVGWSSPTTSEDFLYEVVISDYSLSPTRRVNASMLTNVEINDLSPGTTYIIEVGAMNHK